MFRRPVAKGDETKPQLSVLFLGESWPVNDEEKTRLLLLHRLSFLNFTQILLLE